MVAAAAAVGGGCKGDNGARAERLLQYTSKVRLAWPRYCRVALAAAAGGGQGKEMSWLGCLAAPALADHVLAGS